MGSSGIRMEEGATAATHPVFFLYKRKREPRWFKIIIIIIKVLINPFLQISESGTIVLIVLIDLDNDPQFKLIEQV